MAEFGIVYELETPVGTLIFNPTAGGDGFYLTGVDGLDAPALRTVYDAVPQADGVIVFEAFDGARFPTLRGYIRAPTSMTSRRTLEDELRSHLRSIRRADGTLRYQPNGALARELTVRLVEPVQIQGGIGMTPKEFLVSLIAADPHIYGTDDQETDTAELEPAQGSLKFPHKFPHSYGSTSSGGLIVVFNGGNDATFPIVRIFGQATAPKIANVTTGKHVALPGLSLSSGDFCEIDMRKETVTLNGSPTVSLLGAVDIARSEFWRLEPGQNTIQLTASQFQAGAFARILWRDGYA